jgi:hypothetical protein
MGKKVNFPNQLPLQIDWGLLGRLSDLGEQMSSYEKTSLLFIGDPLQCLRPTGSNREKVSARKKAI